MKFAIPRQGRNGKLAQKLGRKRRRLADEVYYPRPGKQSWLRDQWRVALKERNQLERAEIFVNFPHRLNEDAVRLGWPTHRLEEGEALAAFKDVPTIWAILERNNDLYRRPLWADKVFGAA
jgi:hypothetical protein